MNPLEERFVKVVGRLVGEGNPDHTVPHLLDALATAMGTEHVGITLVVRGGDRFESLGSRGDLVARVDDAQHDLREGPCVEAATSIGATWSGDLGRDERWPRWGPVAAGAGLYSVLATDMRFDGRRVGSINFYGSSTDQFGATELDVARALSGHAVVALLNSLQLKNLMSAIETRTFIGQAQGILMHRHAISGDTAFAVMRRHSQARNLKVSDIAREIVDSLPGDGRLETRTVPS